MFKFLILSISFFLLNQTEVNKGLTLTEMLEIAANFDNIHIQHRAQIELNKKYGIKSAKYLITKGNKAKVDSATFIQYRKDGLVESMTTTECTTQGCLPYITKQLYFYDEEGKTKQIQHFRFKKKYKSKLKYWSIQDTSQLNKFDWEDFNYFDDSLNVESGPFIFSYQFNSEGKLVKISNLMKTNNQLSVKKIIYSQNSLTTQYESTSYEDKFVNEYVVERNKVILTGSINEKFNYKTEFIFDDRGLITKMNTFENGKLKSVKKIYYTYF